MTFSVAAVRRHLTARRTTTCKVRENRRDIQAFLPSFISEAAAQHRKAVWLLDCHVFLTGIYILCTIGAILREAIFVMDGHRPHRGGTKAYGIAYELARMVIP